MSPRRAGTTPSGETPQKPDALRPGLLATPWHGPRPAAPRGGSYHAGVPPIDQLQRISLLHLERLRRQGIFTTGLLLEVSETRTRRQYLADQLDATTNDVNEWRDEALLLNLAGFGETEQEIFTQARIMGLEDLIQLDSDALGDRLARAARDLGVEPPAHRVVDRWHEQAQTLEEE